MINMKKTNKIMASCLTAAVLFSACSTAPAAETSSTTVMPQETTQVQGETGVTEQTVAASEESSAVSGQAVSLELFCQSHTTEFMEGRMFVLRDNENYGAGAILSFYEDGTFFCYDSEADGTYPAQTGTLSGVVEVSDHVYQVTIAQINQDHPTGETWTEARPADDIQDQMDFVATEFDFLSEGTVLTVYDDYANKADMPQAVLDHVAIRLNCTVEDLPDQIVIGESCICVYNESTGSFFM